MTLRRMLAAIALAALAAALPQAARAQTKSDAFAGKIPPVSGQLYRKAGRLELTAGGDLSMNDAFFKKYFGAVKLGYHFTESVSAAVYASRGATVKSGSAVLCTADGGCSKANAGQLEQVSGRIRQIGGVEAAWFPVYGKLNVLSEQVGHFDLGFLLGVDAIWHDEVLSAQQVQAGVDAAQKMAPGVHVGLGARLFLAQWLAVRFEVKDYAYFVQVPNNGPGDDLQNQFFTDVGFSFFFPTRNRPLR